MYKNILVPTDLSDKSERSIVAALELAAEQSGCVELLHIVEKVGGSPDGEIEEFYSKLAEEASQKLTLWQQKFKDSFPGLILGTTILVGKRAKEILGFCQEKQIDLIVMTSRTFSTGVNNKKEGGQEVGDNKVQNNVVEENMEEDETYDLGTLSHQVALFSPVSVLIVR